MTAVEASASSAAASTNDEVDLLETITDDDLCKFAELQGAGRPKAFLCALYILGKGEQMLPVKCGKDGALARRFPGLFQRVGAGCRSASYALRRRKGGAEIQQIGQVGEATYGLTALGLSVVRRFEIFAV